MTEQMEDRENREDVWSVEEAVEETEEVWIAEEAAEKEEKRGNDAAEAENAAFAEDYISGGSSFSCFYSGGNQCCQK